jgi:hypothetical protein
MAKSEDTKTKKGVEKKTDTKQHAVYSSKSDFTLDSKESVLKTTSKKRPIKYLYLPVALILIAVIIFFGKELVVAAVVNNQPIYRLSVIQQLEKTDGKKLLDQIISEDLIMQEAKKENANVSDQQVQDRVKQITDQLTAQGQTLDTALAAQGLSKEELNRQIKLQLMVEQMLGKQINVTDDDISKYYDQNKATVYKGVTLDSVKEEIRTTLQQQQMSDKFQTWIADLRTKSKILYFVNY